MARKVVPHLLLPNLLKVYLFALLLSADDDHSGNNFVPQLNRADNPDLCDAVPGRDLCLFLQCDRNDPH